MSYSLANNVAAEARRSDQRESNRAVHIAIYETEKGKIEVTLERDTVWLSMNQMVELFGRDKSVISRHISNIFKLGELDREQAVAQNATTAADGKTYQVNYFNLDVILSVGYRVKSNQGMKFRRWATAVLKEHLTRGYTVNQQQFDKIFGEAV